MSIFLVAGNPLPRTLRFNLQSNLQPLSSNRAHGRLFPPRLGLQGSPNNFHAWATAPAPPERPTDAISGSAGFQKAPGAGAASSGRRRQWRSEQWHGGRLCLHLGPAGGHLRPHGWCALGLRLGGGGACLRRAFTPEHPPLTHPVTRPTAPAALPQASPWGCFRWTRWRWRC